MKKYLRLLCDTCQRTTDKLVDLQRVEPDKCTITFGCQGRLLPVEYRSNANIISTPEVGVTDWRPRGASAAATATATEPALLDTSTGERSQLVLALRLTAGGINSVTDISDLQLEMAARTAKLTLQVRSEAPKTYRQYVFRRDTTFSSIIGVESGLEKKTLRFTAYGANPDLVEVYLNGVKLEQGTAADQFQVYDGSNSVTPNSILFNTPVEQSGTAQVDVVVSKVQASTTRTITLFGNSGPESRQGVVGSWENIIYVERLVGSAWVRYYLFTADAADLAAALDLNTVLAPSGSVAIFFNGGALGTVGLADSLILFSKQPHSQVDRYLSAFAPLSTLSLDRDYLKYHLVDGEASLQVAETAVVSAFPSLRVRRIKPETVITKALAGVDEQLNIDRSIVVGPDV